MTEFEAKILEKLNALEAEVAALRSENALSRITYFENLPPFSVVGSDYLAFRFNCSESAVIRGRFGIARIPTIRNKPKAWRKADVDNVWQSLNADTTNLAAEYRQNTKNKKGK